MNARLRAGLRDERGDIISSWLLQLVVIMAIIGFLGYEALSIAMTAITLDGDVEQIADVAADAYEHSNQDLDDAREAAELEAERRGAEVVEVTVEGEFVEVTVTKQAGTVVAHRIGLFRDITKPAATNRSKWRG